MVLRAEKVVKEAQSTSPYIKALRFSEMKSRKVCGRDDKTLTIDQPAELKAEEMKNLNEE